MPAGGIDRERLFRKVFPLINMMCAHKRVGLKSSFVRDAAVSLIRSEGPLELSSELVVAIAALE